MTDPVRRSRTRRLLDVLRPAAQAPARAARESLPWIVPVLALVLLVAAAGVTVWQAWDWLDRYAAAKALEGKDFITAKLDAVKIALSIVAGGGALFALYLAVRRQRTAEQDLLDRRAAQQHTELDAAARRVTELYTKAADQFGSDNASVRLAGLYALERLAQDNPEHRQTIINLWCAYLRTPYTPPSPAAAAPPGGVARPLQSNRHRRPTGIAPRNTTARAAHIKALLERDFRAAVNRTLAQHLRPDPDGADTHTGRFWPGPHDLDLTGATLINFDLSGCTIASGRFTEATFSGDVGFGYATFSGGAEFVGATFTGDAWFRDATFAGHVGFDGAMFDDGARMSGARARMSTETGATWSWPPGWTCHDGGHGQDVWGRLVPVPSVFDHYDV